MVYDLARIRYVTQRRKELQGLRHIPLGGMFLLLAIVGTHPSAASVHSAIGAATWAGRGIGLVVDGFLLLVVPHLINRWYAMRFGPPPSPKDDGKHFPRDPEVLTLFLTGAFTVQYVLHLPAAIFLLAITVVLWFGWPPDGDLRYHYRWLCFPIGGLGILGFADVAPFAQALQTGADYPGSMICVLALSGICLLGGIFDHQLLTSVQNPLTKEHHEPTI